MGAPNEKFCETTGKRIFESRRATEKAIHTAERYRARELRAYQCEGGCWGWHMTSEKHKDKRRGRKKWKK